MSLPLVGLLFAQVACGQVEPGASGTITLDPMVDRSEFDTLTISAVEDRFGEDTPVTTPLEPGRRISTQIALEAVDFPYDYTVGGGLGEPSSVQSWYVVAKLVNEGADEPEATPIGTADFIVPSDACGGDFCGIAMDVDLELEPRSSAE